MKAKDFIDWIQTNGFQDREIITRDFADNEKKLEIQENCFAVCGDNTIVIVTD